MSGKSWEYTSHFRLEEGLRGVASASGRPDIAAGAPSEFGGRDDVWSPEHLALAALNTCLALTFHAVARNSHFEFRSWEASATGRIEKVEGRGYSFSHIVVRPRISFAEEPDRERLVRLLEMAKRNCFISNSLTAEVHVEPEVVVG